MRCFNYFLKRKFTHYLRLEEFILLIAILLRLWGLEWKVPHFDEGINGWFADQIRIKGFYAYDPTNYHGPLYFYVIFIFQTLFGPHLWALRLPAVISSLGSVWLALRFDRFIGKQAALLAALALAVSPAAVFYGRYSIHESSLVFSLMLLTFGLFGLWQVGDRRSLWIAVTGATLLLLLKETAVIHLGCFILAAVVLLFLEREACFMPSQQWSRRDLIKAILISFGSLFFFYSGTLLNGEGLLHVFQTIPAWVHTGMGAGGHEKIEYQIGWFNFYWIVLMIRYEWPSLIGFFYAGWILTQKKTLILLRYLAIYTLGALAAYSLIPYKTPWCIVSIIWPFALLFGNLSSNSTAVAMRCVAPVLVSSSMKDTLRDCAPSTPCASSTAANFKRGFLWVMPLLLSLGLIHSFVSCMRLNFWHYVDFSEPYVYVQTSPEIKRVTEPLLKMVQQDPRNLQLRGQVFLESYYPLPWIFGDFTAIGYYSQSSPPRKWNGDFILVEAAQAPQVEQQLQEPYYQIPFQLRDAMEPCVGFFKKKSFQSYFEKQGLSGYGSTQ
ncbi:MAG: TIGR03663 family protein [Verrucomicrobiae bacterium]|nr:TIGR03663 family protein [Verrucomicrobiae bacterium]